MNASLPDRDIRRLVLHTPVGVPTCRNAIACSSYILLSNGIYPFEMRMRSRKDGTQAVSGVEHIYSMRSTALWAVDHRGPDRSVLSKAAHLCRLQRGGMLIRTQPSAFCLIPPRRWPTKRRHREIAHFAVQLHHLRVPGLLCAERRRHDRVQQFRVLPGPHMDFRSQA